MPVTFPHGFVESGWTSASLADQLSYSERTDMRKLIVLLALLSSSAMALVPEDLRGGIALQEGYCKYMGVVEPCVIVVKDGVHYAVFVDMKGIKSIYKILEEDLVLMWSRDAL